MYLIYVHSKTPKDHLQFLDLLLQLGNERLFIFKLGCQRGDLLVLSLDGLFQFLLVAFKVGHSLLGKLQVTLDLPLGLLNVTSAHNIRQYLSVLCHNSE